MLVHNAVSTSLCGGETPGRAGCQPSAAAAHLHHQRGKHAVAQQRQQQADDAQEAHQPGSARGSRVAEIVEGAGMQKRHARCGNSCTMPRHAVLAVLAADLIPTPTPTATPTPTPPLAHPPDDLHDDERSVGVGPRHLVVHNDQRDLHQPGRRGEEVDHKPPLQAPEAGRAGNFHNCGKEGAGRGCGQAIPGVVHIGLQNGAWLCVVPKPACHSAATWHTQGAAGCSNCAPSAGSAWPRCPRSSPAACCIGWRGGKRKAGCIACPGVKQQTQARCQGASTSQHMRVDTNREDGKARLCIERTGCCRWQ